jgi:hypothetical protein
MLSTDFDRWVAQNNIPEMFEYGKGWWDYVELIRRYADKFEFSDVRVVGHYTVRPSGRSLPAALNRRAESSSRMTPTARLTS